MRSTFYPPQKYSGHLWANMKIGLLGGSFNPAHDGHRHISLMAMKLLNLDAIWWMVSPQNPLKSTKDMASLEQRIKSAKDVSNHPKIIVSDIETQLGTQYTADTLHALTQRFSRTNFVWLMGADNLHQIHKWQGWKKIFNTIPIAVFDRPPYGQSVTKAMAAEYFQQNFLSETDAKLLVNTKVPSWTMLHIPLHPLSATEIREKQKSSTS